MAEQENIPEDITEHLNPRQIRFCQRYVIDLNGLQSYKEIYNIDSEDVAKAAASRLLTNVYIKNYIDQLKYDIADSLKVTRERIIIELRKVAFGDIRKYFDESNRLKNISEIDDDAAAGLAAVEVDELFDWVGSDKMQTGFTKKIKTHNKIAAIDCLNKMLGHNAPTETKHSGSLTISNITGMEIK